MDPSPDHLNWSRGDQSTTRAATETAHSSQFEHMHNDWPQGLSEEGPSRSNYDWAQTFQSQSESARPDPPTQSALAQTRLPPMRVPQGLDEAHYYNINTRIESCDRLLCWPKHENDHHYARYVRNSNGMQRGFAVSPSDYGPPHSHEAAEPSHEPISASTENSRSSSRSSQPLRPSDTPLTMMDDEENNDVHAAHCLDSMSRRRSDEASSSAQISPQRRQSRQLPPPASLSFSSASSRGFPASRAPSQSGSGLAQNASIVRPQLQPIDTNTRSYAPHLSNFTSSYGHQTPGLPSLLSSINNRRSSENVSPTTLHPPLTQHSQSSLQSSVYQTFASPHNQSSIPLSTAFSHQALSQTSTSPQVFAGFSQPYLSQPHYGMATSRPIQHLDEASTPAVGPGPIRMPHSISHRAHPYCRQPATAPTVAATASRNVTAVPSQLLRRPNNPYTKWPQTHHESGTGEKWESYNCYEIACDQNDSVPPRKTISQFFGRNKQQTLKIPDGVIPMLCRKCYQQKSYRSKQQHNFYEIQRALVLIALDRAESWPGTRDWCITTSKTLQRAMREHNKRILEGESTANVSDKYSESVLDWLNENFTQLQGEHKTTEECKAAVNIIADGCKNMRIDLLPDFELLPMGDWPEFPSYLWPTNIQLRGNTPGALAGSDASASTASTVSPAGSCMYSTPVQTNNTELIRAGSVDVPAGIAEPPMSRPIAT